MGENHEAGRVSAFDFDIVRNAFKASVRESNLAQEHWADHAKLLFRDLIDHEPDDGIISRIIES